MRLALCLTAIIIAGSADAHSWYPESCCGGRDCHVAGDSAVSRTANGWVIKRTGELIPFTDGRVGKSPDDRFHVCFVLNTTWAVRCLFVPNLDM